MQLSAATGISSAPTVGRAVAQAVSVARASLGPGAPIDTALAFVGPPLADQVEQIATAIQEATGADRVLGGVTPGGLCDIGDDAPLTLLLCQGAPGVTGLGTQLRRDPAGAGRTLGRALGATSQAAPVTPAHDSASYGPALVLADGRGLDPTRFLDALHAALPQGTTTLGGTMTGGLWATGGTTDRDQAVGVRFGPTPVAWGLCQDLRVCAGPWRVQLDHGVAMLDGMLAADRLYDAAPDVLLEHRPGLVQTTPGPGQRPVHQLIPLIAPARRGGPLRLGGQLAPDTPVSLAVPDPEAARREARALMADLFRRGPEAPSFGVLIVDADRDPAPVTQALRDRFPALPWIGWRSPSPFASPMGQPSAVSRAAVVALFG